MIATGGPEPVEPRPSGSVLVLRPNQDQKDTPMVLIMLLMIDVADMNWILLMMFISNMISNMGVSLCEMHQELFS